MLALAFPLWLAGCDQNNVTSTERVPQLPAPAEPLSAPVALPDMPSIGEIVPGYSADAWHGLLAPAGTPMPIVERLAAETDARAHLAQSVSDCVGQGR